MFEISEITASGARPTSRFAAALPTVVGGALALTVLPMIYLHLVSIGRLDPLHTTVSDYVSVPGGAVLLAIATIALAAATAALPALLGQAGRPIPPLARIGVILGSVGLLASVVFPTNVLGTAADSSTVLHRYAAGLFFVALPIAAFAIARSGPPARWVHGLSITSALVGIAFLISHIPLVFPQFPQAQLIGTILPRGLVERVLLLVDIGTVGAIARSAVRP